MFWADSLGAKYVYDRLDAWSKDYGDFFRPCEYLAESSSGCIPGKDLEHHVLDFVDTSMLPYQMNLLSYYFSHWLNNLNLHYLNYCRLPRLMVSNRDSRVLLFICPVMLIQTLALLTLRCFENP